MTYGDDTGYGPPVIDPTGHRVGCYCQACIPRAEALIALWTAIAMLATQ